jgi:hypothetical protein
MSRMTLILLSAIPVLLDGCDSKDDLFDPRYLVSPAICPKCIESVLLPRARSEKESTAAEGRFDRQVNELDTRYRISPPAHPMDIDAAIERDPSDQEILVTGRVGGGKSPISNNFCAFFLTDVKWQPCARRGLCVTPWDYCEVKSRESIRTMLVKLVDDDGNAIQGAARGLLDIKEMDVVAVRGVLKTTFAGSLCFVANGIYVYR